MKRLFGSRAARLGLVAAVFSGLISAGCGNNNISGPSNDLSLSLPDGYAWVDRNGRSAVGYVFASGGRVLQYSVPRESKEGMYPEYEGAYYVYFDRNIDPVDKLIYIEGELSLTGTYTFERKYSQEDATESLLLYDIGEVYPKKTLAKEPVAGLVVPPAPAPITVADIVLPTGQAWARDREADGSKKDGMLFSQDGRIFETDYGYGVNDWRIVKSGTYKITGANVIVVWSGDSYGDSYIEIYSCVVGGDTLKLDGREYTVTSGVNITLPPRS